VKIKWYDYIKMGDKAKAFPDKWNYRSNRWQCGKIKGTGAGNRDNH